MTRGTIWVVFGSLLLAGCTAQPGGGSGGAEEVAPPGDPFDRPVEDVTATVSPFTVLLSSDLTVLIRGDTRQGSITFTARASESATFDWSIEREGELVERTAESDGATTVGTLTITARSDPGAEPQAINVTVTAVQVLAEGADPDTAETATDSKTVQVRRPEASLAATVSSSDPRVTPLQTVDLTALFSGGQPFGAGTGSACDADEEGDLDTVEGPPGDDAAYAICWTAEFAQSDTTKGSAAGNGLIEVLSLVLDDSATRSEATYTAPLDSGTVKITAEASDSTGARVTASTTLTVGPASELGIGDVGTAASNVAPGRTTTLTAIGAGGLAPYEISFTAEFGSLSGANVAGADGEGASARQAAEGSTCESVPADGSCQVTYTAPSDSEENEIVTVEITDQLGVMVTSTISLSVKSTSELRVVGVSDSERVDPGGDTVLTANVSGGTPPYTVTFSTVLAQDDDPDAGIGSTSATTLTDLTTCGPPALGIELPSDETSATALYTAPIGNSPELSEIITVTACDHVGNVATTSVLLTIASEVSLSLTAFGQSPAVAPGLTTVLTATVGGGTPPYTVCFDPPNRGTLSAPSSPNCTSGLSPSVSGQTVDATREYTAPSTAGSDTIRVTVTDAVDDQAADVVSLNISGGAGAACGDGAVQAGEQCDDGNADNTDACLNSCLNATCGDGVVQTGVEACDQGANNGAGNGSCIANCSAVQICGDGVTNGTEACDDGFTDACGTCNATCSAAGSGSTCGDGVICPESETCDDGFTDACGTCNATCTAAGAGSTCGDGALCPETEFCDDGFTDACGACNAVCNAPGSGSTCGDGVACPETEFCDDGFADACGTCNATCTAAGAGSICGDGIACPEIEFCDDGFTDACGTCNATCTAAGTGSTCGDGFACPETEFCDDGLTDACGSCNVDCTALGVDSVCGDGILCPETEFCDDGYTDACGTCDATCTAAGAGSACGDGIVCPETEFCDDGFTDICGSCNAVCTAPGTGSTCGDGATCPETEFCDDGFADACGTCDATCSAAGAGSTCGDGTVCPEAEFCDDGFADACGTCNATCTATGTGSTCGDGVLCPETEFCDDTFTDACGTCNASCTAAGSGTTCGDGVFCPEFEACDDGGTDPCGPCNATCTGAGTGWLCGDGVICPDTEFCDDGFTDACGTCDATCSAAGSGSTCGDGVTCPETESCDDGFTDACGTCDATCTAAGSGSTCGDGVTCDETEFCDDGFTDACGTCDATCSAAGSGSTCGDGAICPETEVCDDGNTVSEGEGFCAGDCSGIQTCGDGVVNGTEVCETDADCGGGTPTCDADCLGCS